MYVIACWLLVAVAAVLQLTLHSRRSKRLSLACKQHVSARTCACAPLENYHQYLQQVELEELRRHAESATAAVTAARMEAAISVERERTERVLEAFRSSQGGLPSGPWSPRGGPPSEAWSPGRRSSTFSQ